MLRSGFDVFREALREFFQDKCMHLAAALSYYTIFSLAPLLIVVIAVAGLAFGREAVSGEVVAQIRHLVGDQGARAIEQMIRSAYEPRAGVVATVAGLVTLFIGATTVFIQLQSALDSVWNIRPKPRRAFFKMLRDRVLSFGVLLGVGFLLLVSLVLNALLTVLSQFVARYLPFSELFLRGVDAAASLGVSTLLFAMIFKFLPDARIRWRDTWVGAFVTALLFGVGRIAIGVYLGHSHVSTTFGAAAALVIVILWVNYSSLILFFGAEFTQVYARRFGADISPKPYAERLA